MAATAMSLSPIVQCSKYKYTKTVTSSSSKYKYKYTKTVTSSSSKYKYKYTETVTSSSSTYKYKYAKIVTNSCVYFLTVYIFSWYEDVNDCDDGNDGDACGKPAGVERLVLQGLPVLGTSTV